jgi:hypothetical protein
VETLNSLFFLTNIFLQTQRLVTADKLFSRQWLLGAAPHLRRAWRVVALTIGPDALDKVTVSASDVGEQGAAYTTTWADF